MFVKENPDRKKKKKWTFSGLLTDAEGRAENAPSIPRICHTNLTMMKLGTVITYLKKIQKYELRNTLLEFS